MATNCASIDRFIAQGSHAPGNQGALFHVRYGDRTQASPVLFIHGIPSWSWLWRDVLPVTGAGRLSIAIDLPGFGLSGKSDQQDFRVTALASAIEQFIDQEIGVGERITLVAHDFGVLVAMELLCRAPERYPDLVITNTSLRADAWTGGGPLQILGVPGLGDLSMALARAWMLRLAMRPFVTDKDALRGERFDGYWYPFRHGFGKTLARLYRQRPVEPADFDRWRRALNDYTGRTLILWGANDPAFRLDEMRDILSLRPDAETMMFPGASHFLPEDAPKSMGRRIRAFLSGIPVTPADH